MSDINNNMDFEQAYNALRETVTALEDPGNKIDETLALYEKACKLVVFCQRKLNETKIRITDINERVAELKDSDTPLFEDEA